jgi:predicted transcriptional regulator
MSIELEEQEQIVFNVVQEYLNKNRYFNMKKILPFIHARFKMASININLRGIEQVLGSLVKKNLIVEGSKFTKNDILKNSKRRAIYNFIVKNPGTYFNKIVKELEMSNHIVIWHLSMLIKFNCIKTEKIDNHEIYFESHFDLKNIKFKYFTSKEKSKLIIDYLKNNDFGITKTKISNDLKIHINTATKYLDFLEDFNVITRKYLSKKILYFLNEEFIENSFLV